MSAFIQSDLQQSRERASESNNFAKACVNSPYYLFSVDLEDVRFLVSNGRRYQARVPEMTERILELLRANKKKITFFTVGDVAREHPSLIRSILSEGHEVACHTDTHVVLDKLTPETFRADLEQNLESLARAGAAHIIGFRAPCFSLVERTAWAYEVLRELGFVYSSSVLPAANPLYGWPGFSEVPCVQHGVLELPMTVGSVLGKSLPYGGGVYLRILPNWLLGRLARRFRQQACLEESRPLLGYLHPFDIDHEQERFPHPGLEKRRLFNALMYYNRRSSLKKIQSIFDLGFAVHTYRDYIIASFGGRKGSLPPGVDSSLPTASCFSVVKSEIANWSRLEGSLLKS